MIEGRKGASRKCSEIKGWLEETEVNIYLEVGKVDVIEPDGSQDFWANVSTGFATRHIEFCEPVKVAGRLCGFGKFLG